VRGYGILSFYHFCFCERIRYPLVLSLLFLWEDTVSSRFIIFLKNWFFTLLINRRGLEACRAVRGWLSEFFSFLQFGGLLLQKKCFCFWRGRIWCCEGVLCDYTTLPAG
jgi:hypothetical protein